MKKEEYLNESFFLYYTQLFNRLLKSDNVKILSNPQLMLEKYAREAMRLQESTVGQGSSSRAAVEEVSAISTAPSPERLMITDFSHWEQEAKRERARNPRVSEREERLHRDWARTQLLFVANELNRLDGVVLKK